MNESELPQQEENQAYDWSIALDRAGTGCIIAIATIFTALQADGQFPENWKPYIHFGAVATGCIVTAFRLDYKVWKGK